MLKTLKNQITTTEAKRDQTNDELLDDELKQRVQYLIFIYHKKCKLTLIPIRKFS